MIIKNKKFIFVCLFSVVMCFSYIGSYLKPVWHFNFVAPQYPMGLNIDIYFNGAQGDVFEIDILNHYVGMPKLADAAQLERKLSIYAIGVVSFLALLLILPLSRFFLIILSLPIIFFPVGFVSSLFYWLYKFGHNLNPKAAINMPSFMPTIIGAGKIGQFETLAYPESGFYLITLSACLGIIVLILKWKKN